jgi:hypothetical protein
MIRLILFGCFFVLSFIGINGQIVISESDFAVPGDTVRISVSDQTTNDPMLTGSGITWDYSSLVANSQFIREFTSIGFSPVQFTFGVFAPQDYQASYFIPENTLPVDQLNGFLPVSLSDPRSYQKSSIDSITKVGFSVKVSGLDVAFKSDTIETKYKFPMAFQQTFSTRGYTFIDLNPAADFKIKQHRSITSTVDGFGQLILPFGTFEVLRLKREITEIDSIYQTFFGTGTWIGTPPIQSVEYEWIGQNNKEVLLKIVVANANGTDQIRTIEFQDIYLGLDAGLIDNELIASVYPNPTNDEVQITCNSIVNKITLFDFKGNLVNQQVGINANSLNVNLAAYLPGIYFIAIESGDGFKTIRVTKN